MLPCGRSLGTVSDISQSQRTGICNSVYVKYIETERRMAVAGGWEEGRMGSYFLVGTEFQLWKMESSRTCGGDGYAIM